MDQYNLTLYVAGDSARSEAAIANLRAICERELAGRYTIDVVDVLKNPELAEEHKILATPTVIRQLPPPIRRLIGDLSNIEKVLVGLDLNRSGS